MACFVLSRSLKTIVNDVKSAESLKGPSSGLRDLRFRESFLLSEDENWDNGEEDDWTDDEWGEDEGWGEEEEW